MVSHWAEATLVLEPSVVLFGMFIRDLLSQISI